jgi:nitrogen-specific signal transduction histidine kinase
MPWTEPAANSNELQRCMRDLGASGRLAANQLFQPFVSSKRDGMGLGLSISRSIIEAHDGQLTVAPNPVGETIFRFTLPSVGVADSDATNRLCFG